jgi:pimeloyl-ACP methyl ester carboxylesterase
VTDLVGYDEFGLFGENAAEFGLPFDGPPVVRRAFAEVAPGRRLSALVWQEGDPELVLLHGGAQNAHTWDTVAMALDIPLVAVDLPGHGHSDGADPALGAISAEGNATDVAKVIEALVPDAEVVVGMSLGGMTAIALAAARPDLVKKMVLVDVTPGVDATKSKAITDFVRGPATFPNYDELLARTIEHNPTRTESSLRRGILHNAEQQDDGSWVWRYRRSDGTGLVTEGEGHPQFGALWDALEASSEPVLLVRGMLSQSVVDDADVVELMRRRPDAQVIEVPNAGHSVQGDTPLELAEMIRDFLGNA